jgi:hypothetical protein
VVAAQEAAQADSCTVDEDGSVQGPPVADYAYSADATPEQVAAYRSEYEEKVAASDALAQAHADAIHDALVGAAQADQDVAESLDALVLPPALADAAHALLQRLGAEGLANSLLPVVFPSSWNPMDAFRSGDRDEWLRLVGLEACFPAFYLGDESPSEERRFSGYYGGGFIEGPDGQLYPLVVPQVMIDGVPYGADVSGDAARIQDLNGSDGGWHLIGRHNGYDQLDEVSKLDQAAVLLGGLAGGNMESAGDLVRRTDLAGDLLLSSAGYPSLDGGEIPSREARDLPADLPPDFEDGLPGYHPARADRAGGALDLAISGAEGFLAAKGIDDNAHHAYDIRLEQNDDGRTRALLTVYDVFENRETGDAVIRSSYGWVNDDGDLAQQPYNFHHSQASIGPANVIHMGVR